MSSDNYVYLGQKGKFFLFVNFHATPGRVHTQDADIYNAAVHCSLVENADQRCIVFSLEEDSCVSTTIVSSAAAENRAVELVFSEGTGLKELLANSSNAPRDGAFVIRFDHKVGGYDFFRLDQSELSLPTDFDFEPFHFKDPVQYASQKELPKSASSEGSQGGE